MQPTLPEPFPELIWGLAIGAIVAVIALASLLMSISNSLDAEYHAALERDDWNEVDRQTTGETEGQGE